MRRTSNASNRAPSRSRSSALSFDPFARAASMAVGASDPGLGLTIAKMLANLMGGELTASSQSGHGSIFTVRLFLPELNLQAAHTLERLNQTVRHPRHGYAGARRKILVVDNEEADRKSKDFIVKPVCHSELLD